MQKSSGQAALVETTDRAHLNPETYKPAGLRKKLTNTIPIAECTPARKKIGWNSAEDPAAASRHQIFEVVVLGFAFSLPKKTQIVIWHENYDIMLLALQGPS